MESEIIQALLKKKKNPAYWNNLIIYLFKIACI